VGRVQSHLVHKREIAMTMWISAVPAICELCSEPITDTFVDGATAYGPWACMCVRCHGEIGYGLGTGKGQRYAKDADGHWPKVEG
jgi:cytochrome c553